LVAEKKNKRIEIEPLQFLGRGIKKQEKAKGEASVRRVTSDHGYPKISFPKALGLKLNQNVIVEKVGTSPLEWEIRIKPANSKQQEATRNSQSH
jgi:hypothetical protein